MIAVLAPLFQGAFAGYGDLLRLPGDPGTADAFPVLAMADRARRDAVLSRFRPDLPGADTRALFSLWSKYYFLRLMPPVLASNLLLDRVLPLAPETLSVCLDRSALPAAFVLPDDGGPLPPGADPPLARFRGLVLEQLAPLISAWGEASGLAARVLWSNASRYVNWFLGELEPVLPGDRIAAGRALLETARFADGTANPFFGAYRSWRDPATGDTHSVRRLCCIQFRLPETPLCEDCPRLYGRAGCRTGT